MDSDDPKARTVFFDIHSGLRGKGRAAARVPSVRWTWPVRLPARPVVLDIACGPGMQTMDLADLLPDARITAVDTHLPFVEEANRRAVAAGVSERVLAEFGDMQSLDFVPASFDLIWCEGAAYIMGVGNALKAWRPLLRPGGRLALTEAVWLREDPPEPVRRCWLEYPGLTDIEACRALVREGGYNLVGDFVLPEADWWDNYYAPMQQRIDQIAPNYAGDRSLNPFSKRVGRRSPSFANTPRIMATYSWSWSGIDTAPARRTWLRSAVRPGRRIT